MDTIAEKIKRLAEVNGNSLAWLASQIGITKVGFYKMLETDSYKVDTLQKIASVYGIPIVYFFHQPLTAKRNDDPFIEFAESSINLELFIIVTFGQTLERIRTVINNAKSNTQIDKENLIGEIDDIIKSFTAANAEKMKTLTARHVVSEMSDNTRKMLEEETGK